MSSIWKEPRQLSTFFLSLSFSFLFLTVHSTSFHRCNPTPLFVYLAILQTQYKYPPSSLFSLSLLFFLFSLYHCNADFSSCSHTLLFQYSHCCHTLSYSHTLTLSHSSSWSRPLLYLLVAHPLLITIMPSSLHIPGLPYMRGTGTLSRLTAASAFLQLPRGPVHFKRNARARDIPSTPACKLPRRVKPDAPRRPTDQAPPVARAIPFPSLSRFKPPSPSPSAPVRYCVWTTPSMSKNGVSRAFQNRRFNPSSPEPSRIPISLAVPSRFARPMIPCPSAPRKRANVINPMTATQFTTILSPTEAKASRRVFSPTPDTAVRARLYAKLANVRKQMDGRSASPLRSILVRSHSDKSATKKGVRFGSAEVREVDFWIDRKRNVFQDGGLWKMGRLQGWRVTPLATPDDDGETEKYMTMWGHGHTSLYYHSGDVPECPHEGCVWGAIYRFVKFCKRKRLNLGCDGENIMPLWNAYRQRARELGHDLL